MTIATYVFAWLGLAGLAVASWLPGHQSKIFRTGADGKHEHAAAHFVVAILTLAAYREQPIWLVGILLCGYAAILEFGQRFVPGRGAALIDWFADVLAVGLALALYSLFRVIAGH